MDNYSRSQKLGVRWRWLFLLGGVIYLFSGSSAIINPKESNTFLGIEMDIWSFTILQFGIGAILTILYVKNQRIFREGIKEEVLRRIEDAQHED